jgi:hypothetical protein
MILVGVLLAEQKSHQDDANEGESDRVHIREVGVGISGSIPP